MVGNATAAAQITADFNLFMASEKSLFNASSTMLSAAFTGAAAGVNATINTEIVIINSMFVPFMVQFANATDVSVIKAFVANLTSQLTVIGPALTKNATGTAAQVAALFTGSSLNTTNQNFYKSLANNTSTNATVYQCYSSNIQMFNQTAFSAYYSLYMQVVSYVNQIASTGTVSFTGNSISMLVASVISQLYSCVQPGSEMPGQTPRQCVNWAVSIPFARTQTMVFDVRFIYSLRSETFQPVEWFKCQLEAPTTNRRLISTKYLLKALTKLSPQRFKVSKWAGKCSK